MLVIFDGDSITFRKGGFHGGGAVGVSMLSYLVGLNEVVTLHILKSRADDFLPEVYPLLRSQKVVCISTRSSEGLPRETIKGASGEVSVLAVIPILSFTNKWASDPRIDRIITMFHGDRSLEIPGDFKAVIWEKSVSRKVVLLFKWIGFWVVWLNARRRLSVFFQGYSGCLVIPSLATLEIVESLKPVDSLFKIRSTPPPISSVQRGLLEGDRGQEIVSLASKKFLFILGGGRWIKNAARAREAFMEYMSLNDRDEIILAIVGETGPDSANVKYFSNLSDEEVIWLYRNARGLLFISLSEGFGYPLIESYIAGIPVVASRLNTFMEWFAEDSGVIFVDPWDKQSIAQGIRSLVEIRCRENRSADTLLARQRNFNATVFGDGA